MNAVSAVLIYDAIVVRRSQAWWRAITVSGGAAVPSATSMSYFGPEADSLSGNRR